MAKLGVAQEYIVRLEDASTIPAFDSADAAIGLHELPWSTIKWGRVENGISTATITVANDIYGATCCPYPLHGWDMLVAIYRNGRLAWRGPLLAWRWNKKESALELSAADLFQFSKKHFLTLDRTFASATTYTVFSTLVGDVVDGTYAGNDNMWRNLDPANTNPYPESLTTGVIVSRTYVAAQMKTLHDVLTELVTETGLSYTCGPVGAMYDVGKLLDDEPVPSLNEQTVMGRPEMTVDCSAVAGVIYATANQSGVGGAQTIDDASWTSVDSALYPAYSDYFSLQEQVPVDDRLPISDSIVSAVQSIAAEVLAPAVTIEAIRLNPRFGIGATRTRRTFRGFDDLIPGLIASWGFDEDCLSIVPVQCVPNMDSSSTPVLTAARIAHARLVSLDVTVTMGDDGLDEEIMGSFIPWVLT